MNTTSRGLKRPIGRTLAAWLLWQSTLGALANPVADPGAPAGKRPIIDTAANGAGVVHIAPPNAAGLSHNLYSSFNLPAAGAILNNRSRSGTTELGGTVSGNPQLGSRGASLILNEVTTASPSSLLGRLEVAGTLADVVIANPWGLTCDGCGFVNAARATLTTGRPVLGTDGHLSSISVGGGTVTIGSRGIDASQLHELDMLARSIRFAGGATATAGNLYAIGGRALIDYDTLATRPLADASGKPVNAVVVPYNGVINANQIYLVATEQGVGVQNAGSLNARRGGIQLDADGRLVLDGGTLTATGGPVAARGRSISQVGGAAKSTNGLLMLQSSGDLQLTNARLEGAQIVVSAGGALGSTGTAWVADGDVRALAGRTFTLDGGSLQAGGDALLLAGSDLRIGPQLSSASTPSGTGTVERRIHLIPEVRAGGNVTLQAGSLINLDGAAIDAGRTVAIAAESVGLIGPKDYERSDSNSGGTIAITERESLSPGSVHARGDISIIASGGADPAQDPNGERGYILLTGAEVESDAGHVSLLARRDIDIANDVVSSSDFQEYWIRKKRFFYTKTTHVVDSSTDQEVKPSVIGGKSVNIAAGGDVNVVASNVLADGAIGLHADNDLDLLSTGEIHQSYSLHRVSKSGVFGSGTFGITIGSQTRTDVSTLLGTQQIGSVIASTAGDVALTAGNQALVLSSEVVAPEGDIYLSAREVAIHTSNNTRSVINSVRRSQSGLTLSAGHPLITAAQTAMDMKQAIERTQNPRLKAIGLAAAGLSIYQAYKELDKTKSTDPDDGRGSSLWTFNAALGSSNYAFDSVYSESLPQESQMLAGGNLTVRADGTASAGQGDVSIVGSALSAGDNLSIQAANDLFLTAATARTTDRTRTRASSGAVGITLNASAAPVAITVAASKTRGFTNGWGTTYFPVELSAGGTLRFESARHTNASGASLDGRRVIGRVGTGGMGDLVLTSPQDESHYAARENGLGFNLSIPVGSSAPQLGVTASQLRLLADWQSAREQTAIRAGSAGYDINVNGTTYLRGAAIASTAAASQNRLVTRTLLHETLANHDNASGSASSLTLNFSRTDGTGALAGSAFGYAQISRGTMGHTAAAVAPGTLNITRSGEQATIADTWRTRERTPVFNDLTGAQARLVQLLAAEPPKYPDQEINLGTGSGAQAGGDTGVDALREPTPEWTAWNDRVIATRVSITLLSGQLAAIDSKVYGQPGTLARSPNTSHVPLLPALDPRRSTEELRAGVAVTSAFGKAAFKEAGDYADRRRDAALRACGGDPQGCASYDVWKEGGRARLLLHSILGGLGYGTAGAVGAAANQLATPVIEQVLITAGLASRNPTTGMVSYTGLGDAIRLAAGAAIGAGVAGAPALAAAASADANNRQLHPIERDIILREARNFARQLKGGAEPTPAEIDAAERRLAQEALRMVQYGAAGTIDPAAHQYLRQDRLHVLLDGDPSIPRQNVGYAFFADPIQKAQVGMYASYQVTDSGLYDFYTKNGLVRPGDAAIAADLRRSGDIRDRQAALTIFAALAAAGLATAAQTPSAITWCMAKPTECGTAIADMVAGDAVGPSGVGGLVGLMNIHGLKSAAQANEEWVAAGIGRLPAYLDDTSVLVADLRKGQRFVMYVNEHQATALRESPPDLSGLGGWATFDRTERTLTQVRQDFALLPEFKSGQLYRIEVEVAAPRVPVQVGFVGKLTSKVDGVTYVGEATQVQLMNYDARSAQFKLVSPPKLVPGGP